MYSTEPCLLHTILQIDKFSRMGGIHMKDNVKRIMEK